MNRRHLPFILLWTLLWALFFSALLLGRARLPDSDLSGQFHTFGLFQAQEMWAGRLPVWSPGSYGGFPFAADTQAAVFYLPRWLTIFLSGPGGFSFYALQWEGLLHIWLAGVFMYALATDTTRSRWAGLLAAAAFGLGGYLISYPLLQLALLETITWLPLVLWLLRKGITRDEERPLPYLLGAGSVLGLAFLAGHPQTFLHISYMAAAYFLFLAIRARWSGRWIVGMGAVVGGTAVGLSAAGWLPALHYLTATTRSNVSYEFVAAGFPLLDYVQLLLPGLFSFWTPMYSGTAVFVLAITGWLARRHAASERKAEIVFWTAVSLTVALLSLGDKGILFALVYRIAPGFGLFRQQERLVGLFSLALALLAAHGFALWQNLDGATRQRLARRVTAVMTALFLIASLIVTAVTAGDWPRVLAQQAAFLLAALLILWRGTGKPWSGLALVGLLFVDLFLAARAPLALQPQSPNVFWPQPDWLPQLPDDEPVRLDSGGLFHANVGEMLGVEDIRGLSPLKLQAMSRLEAVPNARRWQLLNVQYVLATQPPDDANVSLITAVTHSPLPDQPFDGALYRFEDSLPRAWLVYDPIFANSDEQAFQQITQADFDPAIQVVLEGRADVAEWTAVARPSQPTAVHITRTAANALAITTRSDTPSILVISEWDYPGWRAQVDGQTAARARANAGFQAILLPSGDHTINLRFAPTDVAAGITFSLLTLLAVIIAAGQARPVVVRRDWHWAIGDWRTACAPSPLAAAVAKWGMTAVLLLGFGLRVLRLGYQELRGEEAVAYLFARLPAAQIIPALLADGNPQSPFHYLLLHGWMNLTGDSEFAMRFIALVPGVLLLPLIYVLGTTLSGRKLGLLAAFLGAISQSLVRLAQDMRSQYMLALFFGALATALLTRYLVPQRTKAGTPFVVSRRRSVLWLAYTAAAATAVYSHTYAVFILLAHGFYLWQPTAGRVRRLGVWVLSGVTAVLLIAPWLLTLWPNLTAAEPLGNLSGPELAGYLANAGVELAVGSAVDGWAVRWVFVAVLGLVLLGAWALFRQKPAWAAMLTGWWGIPTLAIFLIRYNRAAFDAVYISLAAPAWWLLAATGLLVLWRQPARWPRGLAAAGLGLIILGNGLSLAQHYFDPAHSSTSGYREMAAHVTAAEQPGDVFLAHFPDPALSYYLRRSAIPIVMQPETRDADPANTEAALEKLTLTYQRVWFVPYSDSGWDAENVVGRWLDYHLLHEERTEPGRKTLWAYRPMSSATAVLTPQDAMFGGHIRLDGVYVTVNGQPVNLAEPVEVGPEETAVTVTLLWQRRGAVTENDTVFVHVLDENGALVAQHDGVPMAGTRPTTTWQPGERLLDRHELTLPAGWTGNGRLVVGLYHSDTLARLLTDDGQDALEIGTVNGR